jgi:hypothetical protein
MSSEPLAKPHRSLEIPEIVDIIFKCLSDTNLDQEQEEEEQERKETTATFCALARTCKAFHYPAIQHLWKDVDSLRAIAGVFPHSAWRIEDNKEGDAILVRSHSLRLESAFLTIGRKTVS